MIALVDKLVRGGRSMSDSRRSASALCRSRSEQAPGSVFHPRDESGKIYCDFLGPFWCNIKVDPDI